MAITFVNLDKLNDNAAEIDLDNKILRETGGFFNQELEYCEGLDLLALALVDISTVVNTGNGGVLYKVRDGFQATAQDLLYNYTLSHCDLKYSSENAVKYFVSVDIKSRWAPEHSKHSGVVFINPFPRAQDAKDYESLEAQITEALGLKDKLLEYRRETGNSDGFEILVMSPLPMEQA